MRGGIRGGRPRLAPLPPTPAQLEVLDRLSRGEDVPQITREMGISVNTVRGHLRTVMERLDARTPTHAVAIAIRAGHLTSDGDHDGDQ